MQLGAAQLGGAQLGAVQLAEGADVRISGGGSVTAYGEVGPRDSPPLQIPRWLLELALDVGAAATVPMVVVATHSAVAGALSGGFAVWVTRQLRKQL